MTDGLLDEYVTYLRSWNASEQTVRARQTLMASRLAAWGGIGGVTKANITAFLARPVTRSGKPVSDWTKATYHAHFKSFCEWAHVAGYLALNPMEDVRKPIVGREEPRALAEADVQRVLSVVEGDTRAWVLLALNAGLRVSEIAKLRGEDVTPEGLWVKGKGRKGVTLPCHPDIWELAQGYPRSGYWFPGPTEGHVRSQRISYTVGRLLDALGLEGSIHRFRHTYCTRLLRSGVHVRKVQKLMRHASLATTAGYSAVDEDELREAILTLPTSTPRPPAA